MKKYMALYVCLIAVLISACGCESEVSQLYDQEGGVKVE